MKFTDTILGLLRRWYIVVPGLLIAASLAVGAWFAIPPDYNRSATQLLIPGDNSIPEGGNPYLFLGGLAPAADVLVRAVGSENVLNDVVEEHPGIDVEISRDTTTAGPIVLITVTASSDAAAEAVLAMLIDRTVTVLNEFQDVESIPDNNRMTVIPVTVDEQGEEQVRDRALAVAGVALVGTILTLLIASLVEGSSRRRREREPAVRGEHEPGAAPRSHKAGAAEAQATPGAPAQREDASASLPVDETLSEAQRPHADARR
ncbi:hypothetical protein [Mycetocola sp. 2940]|uniref:hypothetical protein n=1 Tax=Mycetocola sp. 2940 TaxID=3156452 RepID=UPI003395D0D1